MNPSLHCSLIQTNLKWEDKAANRAHLEKLFQEIPDHTHIIILPEMFNTGFSMKAAELYETMDGPTIQWMRTQAIAMKKIITGSLIIQADGQYYNRLIWMLPNGQHHHYDKKHLFGKANEDKYFSAGSQRVIVQVNGWKILLQTCYDLRFPVWARQQQETYDVLLNVANWPAVRSHAWRSLLVARAIENQSYVLGVNMVGTDGNDLYYSGDSAAIDFNGDLMWSLNDAAGIGHVTLDKQALLDYRAQMPFLQDRDRFILLD